MGEFIFIYLIVGIAYGLALIVEALLDGDYGYHILTGGTAFGYVSFMALCLVVVMFLYPGLFVARVYYDFKQGD